MICAGKVLATGSRTGGTAASLASDNAGKGSPSRKRSFGDGVPSLTSDGNKAYYCDVLGRLGLVESGLNSNVFWGGMASPSVAMFCG